MSAASDYLEAAVLNHLFRTSTFAKPAAIYVALFHVMPGEDGTGGTEVSTSGTGYARVQVTQLDANWTDPATGGNGATDNVNDIQFSTATADWGASNVVGMGIYDASTAGNLLLLKTLTVARRVLSGDPGPKFSAGDLDITLG